MNKVYVEFALSLENENVGRAFCNMLPEQFGQKLIEFENFDNNYFHVVPELPYQKDDETFKSDTNFLIYKVPYVLKG